MKYLTAAQIAEMKLSAMPTTERAIQLMAKREGWESRPRSGKGGGVEYPVSALPKAAQTTLATRALRQEKANLPVQMELPMATDLKSYQRETMESRAVLLAEIDRLMLEGLSQGKAIDALVAVAKAGELSADLQRHVATANARGNGNRTLTRATLYNWLKARTEAAGNVVALAPAEVKEAPIPAWAEALMEIYARPTKPSLAWAVERLAKVVSPPPSYDQARRFLDKLDIISRHKGRVGPRDLKRFKAYHVRDVSHLWPGAVMVGDGHTFKAEVANPLHGRPFRPEITTAIDVFTRRICGWSVALAESAHAVADCFRHACITSTVPDIWYYDNGSGANNAYFDDPLTGLLARVGTTKKNSIAYNSQARGVIEIIHKTIYHPMAKELPTYVGKDMDREARLLSYKTTRKDIKEQGQSSKLCTWKTFMEFLAKTISDYNDRPHSSLPKARDPETGRMRHLSPNEAWEIAIMQGWQPEPLAEAEAADLFRPSVKRTVNRALVSIYGNEYYGATLEMLGGQDVMVSYDIHDATKVWVRDMAGRFICEATWDGHKTEYFPKSEVERANENRRQGRIKRAMAHVEEAQAERLAPYLDADYSNVETLVELTAPEPVVMIPKVLAEGERPGFGSDVDLARWLIGHPDQVTDDDRNLLRTAMRSRNFLTSLEWGGVDIATLQSVLTEEEAA